MDVGKRRRYGGTVRREVDRSGTLQEDLRIYGKAETWSQVKLED